MEKFWYFRKVTIGEKPSYYCSIDGYIEAGINNIIKTDSPVNSTIQTKKEFFDYLRTFGFEVIDKNWLTILKKFWRDNKEWVIEIS